MTKKSQFKDPNYKVGYKRPPVASRFQKGRSGNPSGRPRGTSNLKSQVLRPLLKQVVVRENGVPRRVTALEALSAKAVNEGLQGRMKSFIALFKFLQSAGVMSLEEMESPQIPYPTRVIVNVIRADPKQKMLGEAEQAKFLSTRRGSNASDKQR